MSGLQLVSEWCWRFCGRGPNEQDHANANRIDAGTLDPATLLPEVIACDEAYNHAGSTPDGWVVMLYLNIAGRYPTQGDFSQWQLPPPFGYEERLVVAQGVCSQHPMVQAKALPTTVPDMRRTLADGFSRLLASWFVRGDDHLLAEKQSAYWTAADEATVQRLIDS